MLGGDGQNRKDFKVLHSEWKDANCEGGYYTELVCRPEVVGCGDEAALNYNPKADRFDEALCEYPAPDPTVNFRTGCGEDCIPLLGVKVDGSRGDYAIVTGAGRELRFDAGGWNSEQVRPADYKWVLYKAGEPISRGKVTVGACDCPADPYVSFQQGCVDLVPVIGIDFVGEGGDSLSITGNGRDLSYTPGVYREQMRPFDSYTWAIFRGESGVDKGTLLVEVCPAEPTPPPDDPPETGGGEAPIALVAALALVGGAVLVLGVREAVSAKRT